MNPIALDETQVSQEVIDRELEIERDILTKEGKPKLVQKCTLPLTGAGVVSRIYSDYAVLDIIDDGFKIIQINENITVEYLQSVTGGNIIH